MYILEISGVPDQVNDITIKPIDTNSISINWTSTGLCINQYNVTIISNNTLNWFSTTNVTNITISDLIIGSNYLFFIIPIDIIGREGPPSSSIQYIWNGMNYTVYILIVFLIVPVQVVNVSWDQISYDSVTLSWNNTEVRIDYYYYYYYYCLRIHVLLQIITV